MKRILLLVVTIILLHISASAQYVTIPDANFAALLQQKYPACMNGNQMDTTCNKITSLLYLDCKNKSIANLSGVQYFDSLTQLDCSSNQLTSLPSLPASLTYLNCGNNYYLASLPALPTSLSCLYTSYTSLGSLPALPSTLTQLIAENSQLTSLPALPASLTMLTINLNQLSSLPALPASLQELRCNSNQLSSLPALPPALLKLICPQNQLTSLPTLPSTLGELDCSGNILGSLPALPDTLYYLNCSGCNLSSLPVLPRNLTGLLCYNNPLGSLPVLPPKLGALNCGANNLSSLPALPPLLRYLTCDNNQLTSIPPVSPIMAAFDVHNNPGLLCMPVIKQYIGAYYTISLLNTGIRCLPNVIQHTGSISEIDTLPVCGLFNPGGCELGYNIQGNIYNDLNADCKWQTTEISASTTVKMNLFQSGNLVQSVFSTNGRYSFDTELDTYQVAVDTVNSPFTTICKNDTTLILNSADSTKYSINFGLQCKPGFDIGAKSIFGSLFRPANNTLIKIAAGDMGSQFGISCATGTSGAVTLSITGPARYVSPAAGALTPASVNNNVITWNIADFAATVFDSSFNIIVRTDTLAQIDQQVCFTVSITPIIGDNNTANNTLTECYSVRTSYDPNDKQAYPSGNTDTATKWLTYTVRFQNTGNDTAIHIYILDTLSSYLDASTFQLLTASHKNITQVYGNGIIKFNFPNIMLPDSNVNELLSHGYVQYKVKRKEELALGTQIKNTAYIYFDFNAPVVTNTTINTMYAAIVTSITEVGNSSALKLYPNPASNTAFISITGFVPQWISVYDVSGRKVLEQPYTQQLDIHSLTSGVYLVEVRNQYVSARSRVMKM